MRRAKSSAGLVLLSVLLAGVTPVLSQNSDAGLRSLIGGAPVLPLQRSEFVLDPPLQPSSSIVDRRVSSVAVDKEGTVYVLQRGVTRPIIAADARGKVLATWGERLFKIPHAIRVDPAGNVWTLDAESSMVYKFTSRGRQLLHISVGGQPATAPARTTAPAISGPPLLGEFKGTTDIAFATNGHVFISDGYGNARVLEYDADGRKIREWGTRGSGPGQFVLPHGIAVRPDGGVYVADRENGRVQRLTPEGKYLDEWGYGGRLFSLAFGRANDLYFTVVPKDAPNGSEGWLVRVDADTGRVLGAIGSAVHSISIGPDGALFTGTSSGQVLVFRPSK